VYIETSIII